MKPPPRKVAPGAANQAPGTKGEDPAVLPKDAEPKIYYTPGAGKKDFHVQFEDNTVVPYDLGGLKDYLRDCKYSDAKPERGLSPIARMINDSRRDPVDYVGVVAGHPVGAYTYRGNRILVNRAPAITKAAEQGDSWLWDYIERLLGPEQGVYFHGSVKLVRQMLISGIYDRFLALIICGPRNHGKSELARVMPSFFNGTVGDPFQYMTGGTSFNKDLIASVLLMIDDQMKDPSIATKRNLDAMLRQFTASSSGGRAHAKGVDALMLDPLQWLVIVTNDNLKSLEVLPQADHEVLDKIIMLKTQGRAVDWPTKTPAQRLAWRQRIESSVPGYLKKLDEWEIPEEYQDDRYGIKAWQHKELLRDVQSMSNEVRVLDLIDSCNMSPFDIDGVAIAEFDPAPNGFEVTTRALQVSAR